MPETPEEFFDRTASALRMPPVEEWETFPFEGEMRPRALKPPTSEDRKREGEGGKECRACTTGDDSYIWTNENWRLKTLSKPSGLPMVVLLEPRRHFAEPGDLPPDLAAEQGAMLGRVEKAVRAIDGVGRVHVCRWGDGSEHLHWWFIARPARLPQLVGSFAAVWDEILPPTPDEIWESNLKILLSNL